MSGSAGTATTVSRSDHVHALGANIVDTTHLASGIYGTDVAAVGTTGNGSSSTLARSDHTHGIPNDYLTNVMVNSAAGIAYSKLDLTTSIDDGDIAVAAAITVTKLAAGAASKALVTNSGGTVAWDTITYSMLGTSLTNAGTPTTVATSGGSAAVGTGTSYARDDHAHLLAAGTIVNADVSATADILISKLKPYEFCVYNNTAGATTNQTGDGTSYTVPFNTELYDPDGVFASNTFTAPVTGKYAFQIGISMTGLSASHTQAYAQVAFSGGITWRVDRVNAANLRDSANVAHLKGSTEVSLTAGETATLSLIVTGGSKTVGVEGFNGYLLTHWSGHQIA